MRNKTGFSVARGFRVVKISLRIRLQAHRKLMEMLSDLVIAVETFDDIRLAIAIRITQQRDHVPATHINVPIENFQAERLE